MRQSILLGVTLGLSLFGSSGLLMGSEVDELRERAKAMQKEAFVLAERGKKDEAERLKKESVKLLEAAERLELNAKGREEEKNHPNVDKEVRYLKERLQDLLAHERKLRDAKAPEVELAEVREQIARMEREFMQLQSHHARQHDIPPEIHHQAEKFAEAGRRIYHLRAAAQNLKLAEAHDLARQLMEKAEAMEREVQEGKMRLAAEMQRVQGGEHGPDIVRELRAEIERLRAEVRELSQKVEKR
jgi:DNA repair exonuclease SbcCD ATPase subunit